MAVARSSARCGKFRLFFVHRGWACGNTLYLIYCSTCNNFYVAKYWEPQLRNGVGLPGLTSLKSGSSGTNPFKLGAVCHDHTSVSILWLT